MSAATAGSAGLLSRERIEAGPDFNRWLAPPAALAIHLCIGMAYGFSVFWLPMGKLVAGAAACTGGALDQLTATGCNWTVPAVTHIFETFIVMLGLSAALFGGWLERVGPRRAGFIAACCWGGGLVVGGIGVAVHQLWIAYLGCGLIGGIGQGLGYITPVSTLIRWFPDRRGMATGFAIMGYGGGAMIGSPLAVRLMGHFTHGGVPGVALTLITLGLLYFLVMSAGAFGFRIAPPGWRPAGFTPAAHPGAGLITDRQVHVDAALKTPQFWLVWLVLFCNVSAGIAVISMASPMLQDLFGARLLGGVAASHPDPAQKAGIVAAAAGLVGLISLFNSLGRLAWASLSDLIGRRRTYFVFFTLGIALYCALPSFGHLGIAAGFVATICVIISMYGGGFATLPAYLADLFGTQMVGAIHGRLITAWSAAGIVGPVMIASIRQSGLAAGLVRSALYDRTLYTMAGLLVVGLISNRMVRPVAARHAMTDAELARLRSAKHETEDPAAAARAARGAFGITGILAWAMVGVPFAVGLLIALQKAAILL